MAFSQKEEKEKRLKIRHVYFYLNTKVVHLHQQHWLFSEREENVAELFYVSMQHYLPVDVI